MNEAKLVQLLIHADARAGFLRMQMEIVRLHSLNAQRVLSEYANAAKDAEAFAVRQQSLLDQARAEAKAILKE